MGISQTRKLSAKVRGKSAKLRNYQPKYSGNQPNYEIISQSKVGISQTAKL
ncbi:hypothetical protein M1D49_14160 [Bacillus sp. PK3-056]|nr:hypothetical protein [Niallia circulans]